MTDDTRDLANLSAKWREIRRRQDRRDDLIDRCVIGGCGLLAAAFFGWNAWLIFFRG